MCVISIKVNQSPLFLSPKLLILVKIEHEYVRMLVIVLEIQINKKSTWQCQGYLFIEQIDNFLLYVPIAIFIVPQKIIMRRPLI